MSDLIVIGYPDEATAQNVWEDLVKLQTSQPHDAEQQLMKALHGDDPAAPTWEQQASAGATI